MRARYYDEVGGVWMEDNDDIKSAIERPSIARENLGAPQAMGFAFASMRHEAIEKGWFEQELTPDALDQWFPSDVNAPGIKSPQNFSQNDPYRKEVFGHSLEQLPIDLEHPSHPEI